ncbi:MAG: hypothetical protein AAF465_08905 [Pseudomonadota bacterium]
MKLTPMTLLAITATATSLVLAGMLIGQSGAQQTALNAATTSATEPDALPTPDPYQVPDWLTRAPKEWRTAFTDKPSGYALLLDTSQRRLLIDRCKHYGFFDARSNRPREQSGPRCERLLTGTLLAFNGNTVRTQLISGETIDVVLTPERSVSGNDHPIEQITLAFKRESLTLIPGQTNDLMSQISKLPSIRREYQQLFEFRQERSAEQRQRLASTAPSTDPLPDAHAEQRRLDEQLTAGVHDGGERNAAPGGQSPPAISTVTDAEPATSREDTRNVSRLPKPPTNPTGISQPGS